MTKAGTKKKDFYLGHEFITQIIKNPRNCFADLTQQSAVCLYIAKTKATPLIISYFISKPNYDTLDVLSKQKRTKGKIANFINSHRGIIHCAKHKLSKLAPAHHRKNFRRFSLSKPPQLFIKPVFHKVLNVEFTKNLRQISVCKDFELII